MCRSSYPISIILKDEDAYVIKERGPRDEWASFALFSYGC